MLEVPHPSDCPKRPSFSFLYQLYQLCREKNASLSFCPSTAIVTAYETNTQHDPNNNNAMLGVHASASAIIQYGKIARKQVLVQADKLTSIKMNKCSLIRPMTRLAYICKKKKKIVTCRTFFPTGFGECGSGHSESYPYHPHSAHC